MRKQPLHSTVALVGMGGSSRLTKRDVLGRLDDRDCANMQHHLAVVTLARSELLARHNHPTVLAVTDEQAALDRAEEDRAINT
jgi:hypothetical protein